MNLKWSLVFIIIISIVLRSFFLHPTFSDENFYFNVGKNILQGKIPYKDFFFSHPPLQVYTLVLFFKLFGTSFMVGKALTLITSSVCVFFLFLISKELYDKKTAFVTALIFLLTPVFLVFSTMGYGMWETMFLVLFSTYLLTKNRQKLGGITFSIAILFRYLAIIYLPFLIILLYLRKKKFRTFLSSFFLTSFISGLLIFSTFGSSYIDQTISYHLFSKVIMGSKDIQTMQYWSIGYFFLFLSLISTFVGYVEKDKTLLLFSVTALVADIMILIGLRLIFYHYFFISLALCLIATGRALIISKDKIVKIMIPIILLLSITLNLESIDFYLDLIHAERYYSMAEFIQNNTSEEDKIFGEPVATNFVSFVTGRRISSDYLDSYLRHLMFEGEEKVIQNLEEETPKFIIEMENYYMTNHYFRDYMMNNYNFKIKLTGTPNYSVYMRAS